MRRLAPRNSSRAHRVVLSAALAGLALAAGACKPRTEGSAGTERAWNAANDPVILRGNRKLERRYFTLPKGGDVKGSQTIWIDTFWPGKVGGLAARWNSMNPFGFASAQPGVDDLRRMTLRERATLSPAEKYDAFMGNYSYPLTISEKARTHPGEPDWYGLCAGVAIASLLWEEPKPVVVRNPQGIEVPFGSSDIKGLLALYMQKVGNHAPTEQYHVGMKCSRTPPKLLPGVTGPAPETLGAGFGRESLAECEDVNAGSFHLVLSNLVGLQQESFVMDVDSDNEVWNHAIVSYSTREVGERLPQATAAPGTVRERIVETEVRYLARGVPAWTGEGSRLPDSFETAKYKYALEIDMYGNIIGGEWLVEKFPDFIWRQARPEFQFYFHKLGDLVELSRRSSFRENLTFVP